MSYTPASPTRTLSAEERIRRQQLLDEYKEKQAIASVSHEEKTLCYYCGARSLEGEIFSIQCGRCKNSYYCSMLCFQHDFQAHQEYCNTGKTRELNFKRDDKVKHKNDEKPSTTTTSSPISKKTKKETKEKVVDKLPKSPKKESKKETKEKHHKSPKKESKEKTEEKTTKHPQSPKKESTAEAKQKSAESPKKESKKERREEAKQKSAESPKKECKKERREEAKQKSAESPKKDAKQKDAKEKEDAREKDAKEKDDKKKKKKDKKKKSDKDEKRDRKKSSSSHVQEDGESNDSSTNDDEEEKTNADTHSQTVNEQVHSSISPDDAKRNTTPTPFEMAVDGPPLTEKNEQDEGSTSGEQEGSSDGSSKKEDEDVSAPLITPLPDNSTEAEEKQPEFATTVVAATEAEATLTTKTGEEESLSREEESLSREEESLSREELPPTVVSDSLPMETSPLPASEETNNILHDESECAQDVEEAPVTATIQMNSSESAAPNDSPKGPELIVDNPPKPAPSSILPPELPEITAAAETDVEKHELSIHDTTLEALPSSAPEKVVIKASSPLVTPDHPPETVGSQSSSEIKGDIPTAVRDASSAPPDTPPAVAPSGGCCLIL